jgi:hypothetical protein
MVGDEVMVVEIIVKSMMMKAAKAPSSEWRERPIDKGIDNRARQLSTPEAH